MGQGPFTRGKNSHPTITMSHQIIQGILLEAFLQSAQKNHVLGKFLKSAGKDEMF
jgi:hypothetical protein